MSFGCVYYDYQNNFCLLEIFFISDCPFYSPYYTPSCEAVNPPGASGESQRPEDERRTASV